MNKLFTGNGFLTQEGEKFILDFTFGLAQIMGSDEVQDMSDDELRTLQANLAKLVGDAISKKISRNMQLTNELDLMTDEQFMTFLQEKYGDSWFIHSLEKEERARLPIPDLQKVLDEQKHIGEELLKHAISNGVRLK
jgi:hypothetical protein